MIIADQHHPKAAASKPGDTRRDAKKTEPASTGTARSALPHAGETIGEESGTDSKTPPKG
ncbi:hypothetical protein AncyloWKF20_06485 [Ancylobacter sp. WKF20]|uniref:hypothetical protein n=1 Tax=Ancylobacter sp. WKF20 TaxID=3039801 RepID=UPI00243410F4|nr:hypothetical protein [Ancylobacter sp. WKF20]WGD31470.1 hypothetical protein AncyloWKF20_06485 [Ancylobacter sp. WKF20]